MRAAILIAAGGLSAGCGVLSGTGPRPTQPAGTPPATVTPAAAAASPTTAAPVAPAPSPASTVAAPALPVNPPDAAGLIFDVELTAGGVAQVAPGERVRLGLRFVLGGQLSVQVENTVAWRLQGERALQYGTYGTVTAAPGPNTVDDLSFSPGSQVPAGTVFELFGVLRVSGQIVQTVRPVTLTVGAPLAAAPPAPTVSPPAPVPTPAAPTPSIPDQTGGPRGAEIRARLEKAGLVVADVGFRPASASEPPLWYAVVRAPYAQPSERTVIPLAFAIWEALYDTHVFDSEEAVNVWLITGQVWTKYVLLLGAPAGALSELKKGLAAASDNAGREDAARAFLRNVRFRVFDTERQEYVDQKDFISKNFIE